MRIWFRGWRYKRYQVDLIALTEKEIVFVEVKTRRSFTRYTRDDAFSDSQIEHLNAAIAVFEERFSLDLKRARIRQFRFLAISVLSPKLFQFTAHDISVRELSRGPMLKNWWTGHN
jgi:Holliday junction resolvase-like predicted endonuclease